MGGGALYDMGVYAVNAIRYGSAQQMPVRVRRAQQSTTRPEIFKTSDETTEFELEPTRGALATGRASVGEDINRAARGVRKGWYELSRCRVIAASEPHQRRQVARPHHR